jgi:transposase
VTNHDVLYGYRLQLFDLAARTTVANACRVFGVHRSTYYAWKQQVDRSGLGMLRPRERRRPAMPNQTPRLVEERIVSFALGYPGYGPRRIASELARERWGGMLVSSTTVWRVLRRHGLSTRTKRLSLIAGYAAPPQPERAPAAEPHIETTRPGVKSPYVVDFPTAASAPSGSAGWSSSESPQGSWWSCAMEPSER